MKNVRPYFFIAVTFLTAFTSCKKDKQDDTAEETPVIQLQMDLYPQFGTETMKLDSVYVTDEGYKIKFTTLKCYMENVRNGGTILKDACLFDYGTNGTFLFKADGTPSAFSALSMNIGVQSSINHNDPSAVPTSSALNILTANDMHWGWNPGYIFVKIEAKADTLVDAVDNFDLNVVFHAGTDAFLRDTTFASINWVQQSDVLYNGTMKIDLLEFLRGNSNPIDLKTEYTSHSAPGQEALTEKVVDNFKYALSIE